MPYSQPYLRGQQIEATMRAGLEAVRDSGIVPILLVTISSDLQHLVKLIKELGLAGKHVFILADTSSLQDLSDEDLMVLEGSITLQDSYLGPDFPEDSLRAVLDEDVWTEERLRLAMNTSYSPSTPILPELQSRNLAKFDILAYDSVWATAVAAATALRNSRRGNAVQSSIDALREGIYQELTSGNFSFTGLSGPIEFDQNGDRAISSLGIDVYNLVTPLSTHIGGGVGRLESKLVGHWSRATGVLMGSQHGFFEVDWGLGRGSEVPHDSGNAPSLAPVAIGLIAVAILLFVLLVIVIWLLRLRRRVRPHSSPMRPPHRPPPPPPPTHTHTHTPPPPPPPLPSGPSPTHGLADAITSCSTRTFLQQLPHPCCAPSLTASLSSSVYAVPYTTHTHLQQGVARCSVAIPKTL